jgi:outer membrane protein OmpA-like peptidoglycan-associated protein
MKSKLAHLLILFCGVVACGCAAVVIGAGAGAGAAAYLTGRVTRTYDSEYNPTVEACIETLSSLGLPLTEKTSDKLKTVISAKRADGAPVTVEVIRVGPGKTEVGIRTGAVGVTEVNSSETIQDMIQARLAGIKLEKPATAMGGTPAIKTEEAEKSTPPVDGRKTARKKEGQTSSGGLAKRPLPEFTIFFDQGSNELLTTEIAKLDKIVETLLKRPELKVVLNGYTDASGSADYNRMISESRASTVKMYFAGKEVNPMRMTIVGHGAQNFAAGNDSEEGRRMNRRVEINLVEK